MARGGLQRRPARQQGLRRFRGAVMIAMSSVPINVHINSDMQELPMEVKDGYLRRATLLALLALREQPRVAAGGQPSAGHHPAGQVGGHAGHPSGPSQVLVVQ